MHPWLFPSLVAPKSGQHETSSLGPGKHRRSEWAELRHIPIKKPLDVQWVNQLGTLDQVSGEAQPKLSERMREDKNNAGLRAKLCCPEAAFHTTHKHNRYQTSVSAEMWLALGEKVQRFGSRRRRGEALWEMKHLTLPV